MLKQYVLYARVQRRLPRQRSFCGVDTRQIAQHVGEQALTVAALGCGDGRVEATLTKQLQQRLKMPKQTELLLLDVSHSLLNAAYRHCCETLPDIRTYTIHGSFLDLPKMPMLVNPLRGRSRLFAMLGLTK